jgi:exopolyphosphatase/guanosine-5'-triphosphate,3'-diphosphate pyrophosphatase
MRGFRELIKVYEVDGYRAVATSAMRDASNSEEIIARIKKKLT